MLCCRSVATLSPQFPSLNGIKAICLCSSKSQHYSLPVMQIAFDSRPFICNSAAFDASEMGSACDSPARWVGFISQFDRYMDPVFRHYQVLALNELLLLLTSSGRRYFCLNVIPYMRKHFLRGKRI